MSAAAVRAHEVVARQPHTSSYTALAQRVRDEGLLRRAVGFYAGVFAALTVALAGTVAAFVLLGDSWWQLLVAAVFSIIFTQFAFLSHEAAHRQIFSSGPANDSLARALGTFVAGISYSWWMNKHTRHHANPNRRGKDPDIETQVVSFYEEMAATRTGPLAWITRNQGSLFFALLLLEGVVLHVQSAISLSGRRPDRGRITEIAMLLARFGLYFTVVFLMLPIGLGFAFIGVQLAVFGLYMGASFAPNHKGMEVLAADAELDFLSKQVRASRNIRGGGGITALMGGLNHQIEHHLFPSMPRPALARARRIVKEHCAEQGLPYVETSLARSYVIVVRYLNRVGLAVGRDPFDCPVAAAYGR